ncbi:MAG: Rieske (2Fe-2S) protein [Rhodospirillales bacterium]|nr:Rieske (2Fe-2S) protein [Rhodospirillales bacterium]
MPSKRTYRCPLPIPFGWFAVARVDEIAPGSVKILRYFETEFVVWRGKDGKLRATDPYCRHLGAHLGHGGVVVGNDLECPFHNWRYDGTGAVVDIPYTRILPKRVRRPSFLQSWSVAETNALIYAWYHPDRTGPLWQPEPSEEIMREGWTLFEQYECEIAVHIQEITENGVDYPHFRYVHGTKSLPEPNWRIDGFRRLSTAAAKMETPRGIVDGQIQSRSLGPGQSFVRLTGISDVLLLNSLTPIERERTHVRFDFYRPPDTGASAARAAQALARNIIHQLEQDRVIWENKQYQPKPVLCNGDGPILAYRRQYAQYYVGGTKSAAKTANR